LKTPQQTDTFPFLQGGGEMGELIRNYDWSQTALGAIGQWPQTLQLSITNILHSGFPMFLFWGSELTFFYNDAFRAGLGTNGKHPAIGKAAKDVWAEIWDFIGPVVNSVLETAKPAWYENQLVRFYRNGSVEDIYWTFSCSLLIGDDGKPGGVLGNCLETTQTVLAQNERDAAIDRTAQVLAGRKTEESEAKLRSILNSAPTAMGVFVGPDLIVENPNQLMIDVLGLGPGIEGRSFRQILSGLVEEDQHFINLVDTVRTTGEPFEAQEVEVFFKAEKKTRYFNISFVPLRDEHGAIYAVLDVSVDVTEQVLARMKLEESEGRFRLLADASPNLIWMLKQDGSYEYVNKTTLSFLDISQQEIAERGWGPFLHPDDVEPAMQALSKAIQNQEPYELEHRLCYKKKNYRWVLSQASPAYDAKGDVFAYVGSSIDIHEAKKSREELQTALEQVRLSKQAAELGTFDLDLETGYMHWDDRCRTLFGISHQQTVSYDDDFIQRLHPDDQERVIEVVRQAFIKSVSNGEYDVEYRTIGAEDGVLRWVRAKGKVYFNLHKKPVRFIGSVLDITTQKTALQKIEQTVKERTAELAQANESLQASNKELHRSNENLAEFAYAASHDLKEPVRKILVFASRLRGQLGDLNEAQAQSFSRIEKATERMGTLIDDLLLYSYISQRPRKTEAVDLNEKVEDVLEDLELEIEEKEAVIRVGKLPIVQGYGRQFQQLLQNLVSNSVKYSKAGEPLLIEISAEQVERDGILYERIKVTDNGLGFEQQHKDRIFRMFARLHVRDEYGGTGIGLSIVKKVVENHDGFIEVESKVGTGSTFAIYLKAK
jgi:PAS domain S-box-containing protein